MKKNTSEISPGTKKTIIIKNSPDFRESVFIAPRKGKFLDLLGKKGFQRNRGKFIFSAFFSIFFGISAFAFASALEKKKSVETFLFDAKENAETAFVAVKSNDFSKMQESISSAYSAIARMNHEVSPLFSKTNLIKSTTMTSVENLLSLAEKILEIANSAAHHFPDFPETISDFSHGNVESGLLFLQQFRLDFLELSKKMEDIDTDLKSLDSSLLPSELREKISRLSEFSAEFSRGSALISKLIPAAEVLLGVEYPHTIAIFFQNSGEIRATGGFPGSMAIFFANDGKIDATFRDIYYYAWKNGNFFPPPRGFERLEKRLTLRDSNAFFDFPSSAAQMRKMLEISGGSTAETIITISDDLFAEILDAVGGITIPETDILMTQENAPFLLSFLVEGKISPNENPKQILADVIPILREKFLQLPPEKWLQILKKSIENKWILANSNNIFVQKVFEDFGIDGAVKETETSDYLAVISANVGGNKSDHFLSESLEVNSTISMNGTAHNQLTIARSHTWSTEEHALFEDLWEKFGEQSKIARVYLYNILGAGPNHSFTEVFVPLGSRLISADGLPFEKITVFEESGKTVFAFRFPAVEAGKSESIQISYELPKKIKSGNFDLYFQSQPGRNHTFIRRQIFFESGVHIDSGILSETIASGDLLLSAKIQ